MIRLSPMTYLTYFDFWDTIHHIDNNRYEGDVLIYNYKRVAAIFKAFDDENRIKILESLQGGERCACKILEKLLISQSTLSHHMTILVESGIVFARCEGKWTYYSLSRVGSRDITNLLIDLTTIRVAAAENEKKADAEFLRIAVRKYEDEDDDEYEYEDEDEDEDEDVDGCECECEC